MLRDGGLMATDCKLQLGQDLAKLYKGKELKKKIKEFEKDINTLFLEAKEKNIDPLSLVKERMEKNIKEIQMDAYKRSLQVERYKEVTSQLERFENKEDGFKSILFQRHGEKYKGGVSVEQSVSSEKNRRINILKKSLGKDLHILKRLKKGDPELELEIRKLERGEYSQAEMGKVSQDAIKAHKAIKALNDYDFKQKKLLGGDMNYNKTRLHRQSHDPVNMREIEQKNWVALARKSFVEKDILKRIAEDDKLPKSIAKSDDPINSFLEYQYERIINNESRKAIAIEDTFQSVEYLGQMKSWEQGRFFNFRNAEAEMIYNRELNGRSLFENLAHDIIRDSGSVGAMRVLGPNPNTTIKKIISDYGLENGIQLEKDYRFAAGRKAGAATGMLARSAEKARKLTDMTLLSTSLASTLPDLAIGSFVISSKTGRNYFTTMGSLIKQNIKMLSAEQRQEFSRRLGILADDELFEYHRIGEDGAFRNNLDPFKASLSGVSAPKRIVEGVGRKVGSGIDQLHSTIMTYTGLPVQSQMMRLASVKNFAMYMADVKDVEFDNLFKGTKTLLDRNGITKADWDLLRANVIKEAKDGSVFLDAESILDLDLNDTAKYNLHNKVTGMYDFLANTASPTPGVRSKAWVETIDPNSVAGVLARTVAQYKSFSISVYNSLREGYGDRLEVDRTLNLAYTMFSGMGLAYLGLSAKEMMKGKKPPETPDEWMSAEGAKFASGLLARSGTGGLMFDFLSTDYHSPWRSLGADIIGPSPRIAEAAIGIAKSPLDILMAEDTKSNKKAKRNLLKDFETVMPSVPFTRSMINENFFDILHKSMNTGAKR